MIPVFCGRSLVVKHQLPKLRLRVRFSLPAPKKEGTTASSCPFLFCFKKQYDLFGLFLFSLYKQRKTAIVSTPNDSGLFSIPNMLVYSLVFDDSIFLSFQSPYSAICISAPKDSMIFLSIFLLQGRYCIPAVRLLSSTSGTGVAASSNRISLK